MDKIKCTVYAPIGEYSFFGNKSRMLLYGLIENRPDMDIRIIEYQTKGTKNGYVDSQLKSYTHDAWPDPDVCIFFGNPILFNKIGKKNIGFVDTSIIITEEDAKIFIDKCNLLDVIFVCSNYAKTTLKSLSYKEGDQEHKITSHIIITTEYSVIDKLEETSESLLNNVDTPTNFLLEGRWFVEDHESFGDRNKDNIKYILRNYLETFKDIENAPGLIVNTYGAIPSTVDFTKINNTINSIISSVQYSKSLPKVYLLNGILDPAQTKSLYNDPKIIALIHAPQRTDTIEMELNFMSTGKPIIYSAFGSQTEALKYPGNIGVNCQIKEIEFKNIAGGPKLADIYGDYIKYALYEVFYHYDSLRSRASINSRAFLNENDKGKMMNIFNEGMRYFVPIFVESVEEEKKTEKEES